MFSHDLLSHNFIIEKYKCSLSRDTFFFNHICFFHLAYNYIVEPLVNPSSVADGSSIESCSNDEEIVDSDDMCDDVEVLDSRSTVSSFNIAIFMYIFIVTCELLLSIGYNFNS